MEQNIAEVPIAPRVQYPAAWAGQVKVRRETRGCSSSTGLPVGIHWHAHADNQLYRYRYLRTLHFNAIMNQADILEDLEDTYIVVLCTSWISIIYGV